MKIRLSGTQAECQQWATLLQATGTVMEMSGWYPNRGTSTLGRVYVEIRPASVAQPACPTGTCLLTGPHGLLALEALEYLAAAVPARSSEVNAALAWLGGWHTHPAEDDCPPDCPHHHLHRDTEHAPAEHAQAAGSVARQENPQ